MKIDRLLSIVFYLLNRGIVSGQTLADHFNVSRRTILRDIDTLTLAGIPIYAELGVKGGYAIHNDYQLNTKVINEDNSRYILQALVGLKTIYGDRLINDTYEKVQHLFAKTTEQPLNELDFSAVSQDTQVMTAVTNLKQAVKAQVAIDCHYTNSNSQTKQLIIDPLHVVYMWYGWYLFGYSFLRKEYRLYKVIRMRDIVETNQHWSKEYDVPSLWNNFNVWSKEDKITLTIEYSKDIKILVEEYLKAEIIAETDETLKANITLYDSDFMLFSILLGFGKKLKVLSPPSYVTKIQHHLESTLQNNFPNSAT